MTIEQILAQIDMGNIDDAERQRRIEMCLDALAKGSEIRGTLDGKVTVVRSDGFGRYNVTQSWTVSHA